ncbi:MAG: hypothetical protein INR70_07915 [Parafilimonas terrae]|jgi:hypothetical protein|nr:hypothetical protein [Parafilimonas terrae]
MTKFTLGIMADGDDEPVRRFAITAGDSSAAQFQANAAYEKVRREYPDATELHLADGLGHAWNRTVASSSAGEWVSVG